MENSLKAQIIELARNSDIDLIGRTGRAFRKCSGRDPAVDAASSSARWEGNDRVPAIRRIESLEMGGFALFDRG